MTSVTVFYSLSFKILWEYACNLKCRLEKNIFFFFLGPHPQHREVPRLGVKLELQLLAYTTVTAMQDLSRIFVLHHSSGQRQILHPLSEARDQTHVLRSSHCGAAEMNMTSIHEDVGSIPGLAQWVKDLALL